MRKQEKMLPAWFSIAELAAYWKVSQSFVRGSIRTGELSARKFGRVIRISRDEVKRFEESRLSA